MCNSERGRGINLKLKKFQPVEVREDVDGGEGAELKRDDEADGDGHAGDLRHAAPRGRVGLGLDRVPVDVDHHVPRHGRVALDLVHVSQFSVASLFSLLWKYNWYLTRNPHQWLGRLG